MISRYEKEGRLLPSALSCFQGFMASVRKYQCYVQVTELLNSCTFAARMPADEIGLYQPLSAFRGQMGAVYVFDDVLSGGRTPLSQSITALLLQGHGVLLAGQLIGPHIRSLRAPCKVLAACLAGALSGPQEMKVYIA